VGLRFLGAECVILVATVTPNKWFIKKRGKVAGYMSLIGTLLIGFSAVFQFLINSLGWRKAYFVLGCIVSIGLFISNIFLKDNPQVLGLEPDGLPAVPNPIEMTETSEST
jgi:MFS family permease